VRAAFESKFEREVAPEGLLPTEERLRRAEMARKAHFTRLALEESPGSSAEVAAFITRSSSSTARSIARSVARLGLPSPRWTVETVPIATLAWSAIARTGWPRARSLTRVRYRLNSVSPVPYRICVSGLAPR
jgi:hypothetical protein